ncbi:MAG TPA: hypothetical protein PKD86_08445 [Gemmatales bacterium]|nr:hypothetical protein [Gemmatales bacterium]HMP59368.1 hypothetical protein [Gemmatales bacterium]
MFVTMFVTFVVMLIAIAVLVAFGCYRIALHLRGNPEATKAVVEHVLIPMLAGPEEPEPEIPEIEIPVISEMPDFDFDGAGDEDKP